MQGTIGAIQIEEHVVGHAVALAVVEIDGDQRLGQAVTAPAVDGVLQAREGRLAGQIGPLLRQTPV